MATTSTAPPTKRPRRTNNKSDETILNPIASHVLQKTQDWATSYQNATPYPHGIIPDFCQHGFLEKVMEELKLNTKVKFKETDLFRVYQSIDLGNLKDDSELAKQMPSLTKLKHAVYSPEYRAFIEKITGLEAGTLTDEVDCAANCHAKGCHLLCHDDVIGTRKISYIIYLTDPEPTWEDKDGGRLELYEAEVEHPSNHDGKTGGSGGRCVPGALPVKTIMPAFNSMAYFVVEPGKSFHSVQEVFCDRPRLSIQGWYHAKECPAEIHNATLQQLKSIEKGEDTQGEFEVMINDGVNNNNKGENDEEKCPLTQADREFLGKVINAAYLNDESMNEIRLRFEEESSVKLRHFLTEVLSAEIKELCSKEDDKDELGCDRPALNYMAGSNEEWVVVGPAHKQRFLEYQKASLGTTNGRTVGVCLQDVKNSLFQSPSFGRWLGWISSLGFPLGHRGKIRRFRPGLDYTVAHYGILTTNAVLDATLCFCGGNGDQCTFDEETNELIGSDDDAVWESGDVGGFECYISADESGESQGPDAEYDEEDDTKLLSVSASDNTLSLVFRDPGTMKFVKYVSAGAPSSRWDIALEYNVHIDDAESEDENESAEDKTDEG